MEASCVLEVGVGESPQVATHMKLVRRLSTGPDGDLGTA
jgi:hypothetical protein